MAGNATVTVTEKKANGATEFQHNWFVLRSLVGKDFKLKYRRSVLGVLWSVLNPLLMMIVLAAVFSYMFRFSIENYPLYLIIGQVLFDFMNRGTTGAMGSIIESQSLIKKIRIEKMVFPLEKVLFELLNTAISLIAVVAVMVFYHVSPSVYALWSIPLLILYTTMFTAGLGLLISALSVFFRDVMHLWGVLMTAWTYLTPLFYPVDMLDPWMMNIMNFNPMYHYVTYFRDVMMWNINPGGMENLICFAMAAITFLIGYVVFRKVEKKFILYI
jgi:ABC-2 type transport system permease protein